MKPDKKTQKNIAKSLDKLLNKGATKEDFISFAELIIENSQIKSEGTPKVIWDMKESEYSNPDTKFLYGEHFGGIIMMNSAIIPVLQTKREGFLSQTIDMIGHEYTHFEQFQKSDYKSTPSSIDKYSFSNEEVIRQMDKFVGTNVGNDVINRLGYCMYRRLPWEIAARKGGMKFSKEVLSSLAENKYLSKESKKYINQELQINSKREAAEKQADESEVKDIKTFLKYVGNISFEKLETLSEKELKTLGEESKGLKGILEAKVLVKGPLDFCEEYFGLLDRDVPFIKEKAALQIALNSNFPQDTREKFQKKCVQTASQAKFPEQIDESFAYLFTKDQVNEVFENVIKNGELQVLESEFFGIAIARYSDELPIELSKVILEKYFAKELVSKNKEQAGALKSLCMTLLYHLKNKNVDGNLVNNFEKIIEREGIRTIEFMLDDDTQVTKESAVSKKR